MAAAESMDSEKVAARPAWVRYVRFFCAVAVVTAASIELWTNTSDIGTFGWGAAVGAVATIVAKKATLLA